MYVECRCTLNGDKYTYFSLERISSKFNSSTTKPCNIDFSTRPLGSEKLPTRLKIYDFISIIYCSEHLNFSKKLKL